MSKSIRQQFADTMLDVGLHDPKLVVMVGDISHFILQPFAKACPGRYYNVGICEPTIVSMAAGLSKIGLHPVVHTIAPFIVDRCFEQMKLDFGYQRLGGNLITVGSAFDYSNLGSTHHCYGDFALLKIIQGSQIIYPGSAGEFDTLFRQAYQNEALKLYRLPEHQHEADLDLSTVRLGSGIKVQEGTNLTIIATGPQLKNALGASEALQGVGWEPEIIYIHTIRPLDNDLVRNSVLKTRRVVVVEEHMRSGGLGDDVLRTIIGINDVKYLSIAIPDTFVTGYGTYAQHCERLGMTREGIFQRVTEEFGAPIRH